MEEYKVLLVDDEPQAIDKERQPVGKGVYKQDWG